VKDFTSFKRAAIHYWETRRIFYNLALVPPTLLGLYLGSAHSTGMWMGTASALLLFLLYVIAANICFTFAYAVEFLAGSDDERSWWRRFGRPAALVAGIVFGMLLALFGGSDYARVVHCFAHSYK